MVRIFEKVPSSYDNEYGIDEVNNFDVFLKGPCVIVLLAKTWLISSVNGAMKLTANLVNPNIDDRYDPSKRIFCLGYGNTTLVPFGMGDMAFTEDEPNDVDLEKFVSKYFLPLVSNNGKRLDIKTAMSNLRNINFVTYCNGSLIHRRIEKILEEKMRELGFNDEAINLILSQSTLAAISGDEKLNTTKASTLLFTDKNDTADEGLEETLIKYDNYYRLVIKSNGQHDLRRYMRDDIKFSKAIKEFLCSALNDKGPIKQDTFVEDVINRYDVQEHSAIQYKTISFKMNHDIHDKIYNLYRSYKKTNIIADLEEFVNGLNINNDEVPNSTLEISYKGNEIIGFCLHGYNIFNQYELELMVCSPLYRKNGIGTKLFNNALYNMNQNGIDKCTIESARKYDDIDFWFKKGAIQVSKRTVEEIFTSFEVSILEMRNIKEYLDKLEQPHERKLNN